MGLRTHWNGMRRGYWNQVVKQRDIKNPYTSYRALEQYLYTNLEGAKANLRDKVKHGFISLEELVEEGRAAELFRRAGIFDEAVASLAPKKAVVVGRDAEATRKFLVSGKGSVPYVLEYLSAVDVAMDLVLLSEKVTQRSVTALKEVYRKPSRYGEENVLSLSYELQYDEQLITTSFLPYPVQKILCFAREPKRVVGINRGVVITDQFVSNIGAILDEMAKLKCATPLDCILIHLRTLGGLIYPTSISLVRSYPNATLVEFRERDHFTEGARAVLQEAVTAEFEKMREAGGNPLSFRVYVRRANGVDGKDLYLVDILWEKK